MTLTLAPLGNRVVSNRGPRDEATWRGYISPYFVKDLQLVANPHGQTGVQLYA